MFKSRKYMRENTWTLGTSCINSCDATSCWMIREGWILKVIWNQDSMGTIYSWSFDSWETYGTSCKSSNFLCSSTKVSAGSGWCYSIFASNGFSSSGMIHRFSVSLGRSSGSSWFSSSIGVDRFLIDAKMFSFYEVETPDSPRIWDSSLNSITLSSIFLLAGNFCQQLDWERGVLLASEEIKRLIVAKRTNQDCKLRKSNLRILNNLYCRKK